MAESDVTVILSGDDARLAAAQRRASRNQDGLTDAVGRTAKGAKSAEIAAERFAAKLSRDNATPLEKAQQHLGMIQRSYDRVLITHQTYDRSVRETVRGLAQTASLTERQAAAQLGLSRAYGGRGGMAAIGGKVAGGAQGLLEHFGAPIGLLGGAMAVEGLFSSLKEIRSRNREESVEMLKARAYAPTLLQVARTPEEFAQRKAASEGLFRMGATAATGGEGLKQAQELESVIHGAGMDAQRDQLGELAARRIIKPEDLAGIVDRLEVLRNTVAAGQDPMKTLAQAMAVRGNVSIALPEMLEIMAKVGEHGRQQGMDTADVTALAVTMAETLGTARKGASGSAAIMTGLEKVEGQKALEGLNFTERIQKIDSMGGTDEQLKEVFGESFIEPFRALVNNMHEFNERRKAVQATDVSLLNEKVAAAKQDVDAVLDHAKRVNEAAGQLENKKMGRYTTAADTLVADHVRAMRDAGRSEWFVAASEQKDRMKRGVMGDKAFIESSLSEGMQPETRAAINTALGRDQNTPPPKAGPSFGSVVFGQRNAFEKRNAPVSFGKLAMRSSAMAAESGFTGEAESSVAESSVPVDASAVTAAAGPTVTATPPAESASPPPAMTATATMGGPSLRESLDAAIQMGAKEMEAEIRAEMATQARAVEDWQSSGGSPDGAVAGGTTLSVGGTDVSGLERAIAEMNGLLREQTTLMRERQGGGAGGGGDAGQPASRRGELLQEVAAYS